MEGKVKMFDLTGKVAIVTGGSQGIGEGIALGLARAGADVVVAARTAEKLKPVVAKIEALGRRSLSVVTDVTREESVKNLVTEAARVLGGVDILVNNAGAALSSKFRRIPVLDLTPDEFDACIALNLKSVYYTCRAVVPIMRARGGGSIINISSTAARAAEPPRTGFVLYGTAKAGMITLTRGLAMELAPVVRVNCILPGAVNVPNTRNRPPEVQKSIEESTAMGRPGEPEDIAGAVVYFASDASLWTTGSSLEVDGGLKSSRPASSSMLKAV